MTDGSVNLYCRMERALDSTEEIQFRRKKYRLVHFQRMFRSREGVGKLF